MTGGISKPGIDIIGPVADIAISTRVPRDTEITDRHTARLFLGIQATGAPDTSVAEELEQTRAILCIRRMLNKHNCRQFSADDPECAHKHHFRDIAMTRDAMKKIFLVPPAEVYLAEPYPVMHEQAKRGVSWFSRITRK